MRRAMTNVPELVVPAGVEAMWKKLKRIVDGYEQSPVGICNTVEEAMTVLRSLSKDAEQDRTALVRAERKLSAYVGVCKGDKELTGTVLPMVRAALAAKEKE